MKIEEVYSELRTLEKGEHRVVYQGKRGTKITATRTDKICPHDFVVGLIIPSREEFFPTHVRLLFDLYLKRLSNKEGAEDLFIILERVFDGEDPEKLFSNVLNLKFPMQLDDPDVNLYYSQLLMTEQDFNYGPDGCKRSNFDLPRGFLMGFIRWVASGDNEIDKIITAAVRNYPPPAKYKGKFFKRTNLNNFK